MNLFQRDAKPKKKSLAGYHLFKFRAKYKLYESPPNYASKGIYLGHNPLIRYGVYKINFKVSYST